MKTFSFYKSEIEKLYHNKCNEILSRPNESDLINISSSEEQANAILYEDQLRYENKIEKEIEFLNNNLRASLDRLENLYLSFSSEINHITESLISIFKAKSSLKLTYTSLRDAIFQLLNLENFMIGPNELTLSTIRFIQKTLGPENIENALQEIHILLTRDENPDNIIQDFIASLQEIDSNFEPSYPPSQEFMYYEDTQYANSTDSETLILQGFDGLIIESKEYSSYYTDYNS